MTSYNSFISKEMMKPKRLPGWYSQMKEVCKKSNEISEKRPNRPKCNKGCGGLKRWDLNFC